MNRREIVLDRRRTFALAVGALFLVAAGAFGMYLYLHPHSAMPPTPPVATLAVGPSTSPSPDVVLTLSQETLARAGIQTSPVHIGAATRKIGLPGVVEANAYRQVLVSAVAAGQVRSVTAELGAHVRAGQPLATLHSPELAEAERVYVSMEAELAAAHQRLVRLESLVKIGAASREEYEAAQAEHTKHDTDVEGARARLLLFGLTAEQVNGLTDASRINPVVTIAAPSGGVVIRREINRGQNVEAARELFTIADLSTVWIVGDLYERDLGRVRIGSRATMTSAAFPGQTWTGVVTYIDAQVAPETRTARVRVETSNPGERLRLGMFVDVVLGEASPASLLMVPRSAVQTIGSQSVVYVADESQAGRFFERAVRVGAASGEETEVTSGLADGARVVTTGSFFLRAERDRLGLPPPAAPGSATTESPLETARVEIAVTTDGFAPPAVKVPAGKSITLVFTRKSDATCATEVVFPSLKVRKDLPVNKPTVVEIPPQPAGEISFVCGMNMLRGTVVVR